MSEDYEFSTRSMKHTIASETSKRVSENAAHSLGKELQDTAEEIVETALELLEDKDRKTLRAEEIREAINRQ